MPDPSDNAPQREPLAAPVQYQPVATNQIFPTWERNLKFAALAALVVVAVVGYRYWKSQRPAPVVTAVHFPAAAQWTNGAGLTISPAISHSGKLAAYASDRDGPGSLAIWTQPFDSGNAKRLTGGEFNESDPDFSPDDRHIVFRSDREGGGIYVVPVDGSIPPRLVVKEAWRPKFSPDGNWIAFSKLTGSEDVSAAFGSGQIFIVPAEGGDPKRIQPDFPFARFPIWAPDGRHLMFVGTRGDGAKDWWVASIDGGEAVRTHAMEWLTGAVKSVGTPEQWRGEKIFLSASEETRPHIWEMPVSLSSWQVTGHPRQLTGGKEMEQQGAIGPDGRLLFTSMKAGVEVYGLPIEPDQAKVLGKLEALTNHGGRIQLPSVAVGGSKMVYLSDKSGIRDVWTSDIDGKSEDHVTTFRTIGYRPVISADGKNVIYPTSIDGKCAVLLQPAALNGRPAALKGCFAVWDWSPDSASLLTFRSNAEMKNVELMQISSQQRSPVLTHPTQSFYDARFSPDGRWIAFASGLSSGRARIFIAPLRIPAAREAEWIPIHTDFSGQPAWSPDGSVLYFRSKRDGYHCIWAQKLGAGKKPLGEPIAIQHLHSVAFGAYLMKATEFNLSVGKDRLILNVAKDTANLWTARIEK